MGLMILKCPKCGQSNLIKENEHYRCPVCESIIFNDEYKTYQEAVEKLIQEGKEADIGVLRYSLNTELEQVHLNIDNIKNICRQIKAILPEDIIASFYLSYVERKSYPRNYELYLKTLIQEKANNYEINQLVPVIINSCDIRVKEVVEELLKSHNLYNQENKENINQALQEREQELERYDTEKDVFLCHSSKDIKDIQNLVACLEDNNISCWYSERNLPWDIENYWEGIHKAIKDCKVFLFVLSKYSRVSKDVVHELDYARSLNKEIKVEYRIDESENNIPIKKFFDGIQWIDGSKQCKYEELAEKIYNYLENNEIIDEERENIHPFEERYLPKSNYNKIEFYLNFEEYDSAITEIRSQMMEDPYNEKLWKYLLDAELQGKKEKNDKAIKTYNRLIELVDEKQKEKLRLIYAFLFSEKKETPQQKNYKFIIKGDKLAISKYLGNEAKVVIPDFAYVDGKEYDISTIDMGAFENCLSVTELELGKNIEIVGKDAFNSCNSLKKIYISKNVKDIASSAFLGCTNIESIIVSEENKIYDSRNGSNIIVKTETDTLVLGCKNSKITNTVKELGEYCFAFNSNSKVDLPLGITYIGKCAFMESKLKEISVPETVKKIDSSAFLNCSILEKIVLPNSIKEIQSTAFDNCNKLKSILYNGTPTEWAKVKDYSKINGEFVYFIKGDYKEVNLPAALIDDFHLANLGNSSSQIKIANYYFAKKEYSDAIKLFELLAKKGEADSQLKLAMCYMDGLGVEKDYYTAAMWLRKASLQNNSIAQRLLGDCYYYGNGVAKESTEAVKWYKLSAQKGDAIAQFNMGNCYKNGTGVNKSHDEAVRYYKLSAKQGCEKAIKGLRDWYGVEI